MDKSIGPGKDHELPYDVQNRYAGPINRKLKHEIDCRMEIMRNRMLMVDIRMQLIRSPFKC